MCCSRSRRPSEKRSFEVALPRIPLPNLTETTHEDPFPLGRAQRSRWPPLPSWPPSAPTKRKKLGTTLTPTGAERAGNADKTIPEYTGGLTTPPAGLREGLGYPSRPLRGREAALRRHRSESGAVRRQAHRRDEGVAEEVSDHARGRLPLAPLDRLPEVRAGQHGEERHLGEDHGRRPGPGRHLRRHPVSDPPDRQRGHVEPPPALHRAELLHAVRRDQRRLRRQGGAGHHGADLHGLPVLRP